MTSLTHDFILTQGARRNDTRYILAHDNSQSTPTQHGAFLMRSYLETLWAQRFEHRGFKQATPGITQPPCYFFEPAGMKRWPNYPRGHHYRVDFILVYEVDNRAIVEDKKRLDYGICSVARRWEWVSIKPTENAEDLQHLIELVAFDSRHQRAFQCCGQPDNAIIHIVVYDPSTGKGRVR